MAKRKSPESVVVKFFYEAPLDVAESLLAVVKGVVADRKPPATRKRGRRQQRAAAGDSGSRSELPLDTDPAQN